MGWGLFWVSRKLATSLWVAEQCQNKVQGGCRVILEPPSFFFFLAPESAKLFWPKYCVFEFYADNSTDTWFSPQGLWWNGSSHQTSACLQMSQKASWRLCRLCFANHVGCETDTADRQRMSHELTSIFTNHWQSEVEAPCFSLCVCVTRHTSDLFLEE